MTGSQYLVEPQLALRLITYLSWVLIVLGVGKMILFAIGEWMPRAYSKIESEWFRKLCTGKGNRLLFGLGGFITAFIGLGGLILGRVFAFLFHLGQ